MACRCDVWLWLLRLERCVRRDRRADGAIHGAEQEVKCELCLAKRMSTGRCRNHSTNHAISHPDVCVPSCTKVACACTGPTAPRRD
eukprot:4843878-Prymnesium_polylepis.3